MSDPITLIAPIFSKRRIADLPISLVYGLGAARPGIGSTVNPSRSTISLISVLIPATPVEKSMRRFKAA